MLNKKWVVHKKHSFSVDALFEGILKQDIVCLSQAITYIESTKEEDFIQIQNLLKRSVPYSGNAIRIGVTGIPGVGKSAFINVFVQHVLKQKKKIAILAVDPSSQKTKGSILGDKHRMSDIIEHPNVFIRPIPSRGFLGGVSQRTMETMLLCEAFGCDVILVESVGVGQSEIALRSLVDILLFLTISNTGDEIQMIKKGILEVIDAIILTKADIMPIKATKTAYKKMMQILQHREVFTQETSIVTEQGFSEVWNYIQNIYQKQKKDGVLQRNRKSQQVQWLHKTLREYILKRALEHKTIRHLLSEKEKHILSEKENGFLAMHTLYEAIENLFE